MSFAFHKLWFAGGFAVSIPLLLAFYPERWASVPADSGQGAGVTTTSRARAAEQVAETPSLHPVKSHSSASQSFPVEISILADKLQSDSIVPVLRESDARALLLSEEQTAEINRLFVDTMESVRKVESRHLLVSTDEAGNPVVAVLSWADEAETLITQLITDLSLFSTPQQAEFLARHYLASAFGGWGTERFDFGIREENGTRTLGIGRRDPFQQNSGTLSPYQWGTVSYTDDKQEIQTRYSHILQHFPDLDK